MSWTAMLILAAGVYLLKAAGPMLLGGRELPPWMDEVAHLLPCALLAGLIMVQTVTDGQTLVADARILGLAAAGVAVLFKAPFLAVVSVAMAVVALARLAGMA